MSDIKDLGDEKTVLDGTEWIPGQQTDGITFHAPASALGVGPFTDGDGNVYSITFDSAGQRLLLHCVQADDGEVLFSIGPGSALMQVFRPDSSTATQMSAQLNATTQYYQSADSSFVASIGTGPGGVTINDVVVDPTLPWPGG